ncbi:MAG: succinate dehydrogenase [Pyrinomonadaceae bacterium]
MAESPSEIRRKGFGATMRRDAWWVELIPVVIVLGGFGIYATLRAFEGHYYEWGPYLSPFYSPLIDPHHHWWPFSPAILILGAPLGFRATCYYYRKAYYRAFFLDPPACAVGEARPHRYRGETAFPFILQNLHRYFLYLALIFLIILWYDAVRAFWFDSASGKHFGVGGGSLVLLANIILLSGYTLSCHSLRHIVGGKVDCFSCVTLGGPRHSAWRGASFLNEHHMLFAWLSLSSVGLADFYIRLVATGAITDLRLL